MESLTYKDIVSRQRNLITDVSHKSNINVEQLYDSLKENYSYHKAKLLLENWSAFGNEDVALHKVMEVFTIITDNDSISNIENASNIIESNIIPKLRNAKQTNKLNHYKRGWIKHKHTSMLNDTKDNENAVAKAKSNGGYLGNSLHPNRKYKRDIFGRKMGEVKKSGGDEQTEDQATEEKVEECFDRFNHIAYINEQCDRVLTNHQKLAKRFNLDNVVRKCPLNYQSYQDCIYNICSLIETYDIPQGLRYLITLENTMYLMHKNCVPVENSFIVETVTDYFLMSESEDYDIEDTIKNLKYIIENSRFFSKEDLSCVEYLCINEQDIIDQLENEDLYPIEENKVHDMFLKFKNKKTKTIKKQQKIDSLKIKKTIHDFKKSNKKSIESFKATISRIFVNSPEGIINELPDIFAFVRLGIVIGGFAINPILGVIVMITNFFLKMKVSRERMEIVVEQYTKERDNYKKKMNEATDEKKKEKYEKLYKQYKQDVTKLEAYRDELYTEAENEKRMEEKYAKEAEENSDDFDFDMDFNFDEQTAIEYTGVMATLYEQLSYSNANLIAAISNNISKVSNDDIYNITEAVKLCNDIVDCPRYVNILEDELLRSRSIQHESYIPTLQRIDGIKICISDINQVKYNSLLESTEYITNDNNIPDIKSIYEVLKCKNDIIDDTIDYLSSYNSLNESKDEKKGMSFMSKLKIASQNLKRFALKAKDKDKQLSMKLDSELNRTMKSAKKAMISDSRENIIKGSFLPSASRCIHIALASGAAFLISPVLAVISLIGYIGCSKSLTEKERNLILDDIDIEIKMCDKYMKIAEDKDDLTAVREIMKTKRDLERQRARILYNKNYIFKGKKQYDMKPKSMVNKDDD